MRIWINCASCSPRVAIEPLATQDAQCPGCGQSLEVPGGPDVFVSYATPDIEVAKQVCAALHARKLNHWLAPEKIETGDFFATAIADNLKKSKVVVLVLSEHAANSPWVQTEITTARSSGKVVLPFKIQQFDLPSWLDFILTVVQWQEAYRGSIENEIELLVARVEERLRALRKRSNEAARTSSCCSRVRPNFAHPSRPGTNACSFGDSSLETRTRCLSYTPMIRLSLTRPGNSPWASRSRNEP